MIKAWIRPAGPAGPSGGLKAARLQFTGLRLDFAGALGSPTAGRKKFVQLAQ